MRSRALLDAILYSALLVLTPFLMLQAHLQRFVWWVSLRTVTLPVGEDGVALPIVGLAACGALAVLLTALRRHLTRRHLAAGAVVAALLAFGHATTDYYLDGPVWGIQQNWHYLAYAGLALLLHRALRPRVRRLSRLLLLVLGVAAALSMLDEAFQLLVSDRVFDLSDVAKDLLGTVAGLVLVCATLEEGRFPGDGWRLCHPRLAGALDDPVAVLVHAGVFALLFVGVASQLTEVRHAAAAVGLPLVLWSGWLLAVHLSPRRGPRRALCALGLLLVGGQAALLVRHHGDGVVWSSWGLTVCNGVPVPYLDLIVHPDGSFRPVDKKHRFNRRDVSTALKHEPDVLIVSRGFDGAGGEGLPGHGRVRFVYSHRTRRMVQVLLLTTPRAVEEHRRLRAAGRRVVLVVHST